MSDNIDLGPLEEGSSSSSEKGLDELRLILDVYKHHWDAFLKGFGLYLIACSILVGYGLSQQADIYNKVFSGVAIIVASIFMFFWNEHSDIVDDRYSWPGSCRLEEAGRYDYIVYTSDYGCAYTKNTDYSDGCY